MSTVDMSYAIAAIVCVVLAASVLSHIVWSAGRSATPVEVTDVGRRLFHAAMRAALMADQQGNCLIAHAEISKAAAYVASLRLLLTDTEITAAFNVDIRKLVGDIERGEQRVYRSIAAKAPAIMPTGGFSVHTGMVP
jgi:hypothetical protein